MADNPPFRFVFHLRHDSHDEGGDQEFVFFFPFTDPDQITKIKMMTDEGHDAYEATNDDLESEYGVHDFVTSGEHELIGFTSYEVEPEKWMQLVETWRTFFVEQGIAVGEITGMRQARYTEQYCS